MVEPRKGVEAPVEVEVSATENTNDEDDDGDTRIQPRSSSTTTATSLWGLTRLAINGVTQGREPTLIRNGSAFSARQSL
jgi:hypothetical protein